MIGFKWPWLLWLLLLLPVAAMLYRRWLPGRAESVAMHPDLAVLRQLRPKGWAWKRDLPALLYGLALASSVLAFARPTAPLPVPDNKTTIMLVLDVSLSMNADDISPSRFAAAQQAAKIFLRQLPKNSKVGLVSFAGYAVLEVPPTTNLEEVIGAVDRLELGRGTAIGRGLEEALRALPDRSEAEAAKYKKGDKLAPAAIVLLSDGRNNRDIDPLEVAPEVAKLEVKTYTVGLGTNQGIINFGEQGGGFRVGFDAETLKRIAQITGGKYFEANSSNQLSQIYKGLGRSIGWVNKPREITSVLAVLAGLFLAASLLVGQISRRVV